MTHDNNNCIDTYHQNHEYCASIARKSIFGNNVYTEKSALSILFVLEQLTFCM